MHQGPLSGFGTDLAWEQFLKISGKVFGPFTTETQFTLLGLQDTGATLQMNIFIHKGYTCPVVWESKHRFPVGLGQLLSVDKPLGKLDSIILSTAQVRSAPLTKWL